MTPTELRAAAKALAAKFGPWAEAGFEIWSVSCFDGLPPVRVHVMERYVSFSVHADTFEAALELAEREWDTKRAEYRREAIARKRAELAELEGAQ